MGELGSNKKPAVAGNLPADLPLSLFLFAVIIITTDTSMGRSTVSLESRFSIGSNLRSFPFQAHAQGARRPR